MFRRRLLAATRPAVETWDYVWDYTMGDPMQVIPGLFIFQQGPVNPEITENGVILRAGSGSNVYSGYRYDGTGNNGVLECTAIITSPEVSENDGFRLSVRYAYSGNGAQLCVRNNFGLYTEPNGDNYIGSLPNPNAEHTYRLAVDENSASYWVDGIPVALNVPHSTVWVDKTWVGVRNTAEVLLRKIKIRIGWI